MSTPRDPDPTHHIGGARQEPNWWEDKTKQTRAKWENERDARQPSATARHEAPHWNPGQHRPTARDSRYAAAPRRPDAVPGNRPTGRTFTFRRLFIGIGIIVIAGEALALVLGVGQLDMFGGKQLDVGKVQAGVQQILTDPVYGYGPHTVNSVSCNDGQNPSADKGGTFTCAVTVDGSAEHVTVVVEDDIGTYSVDRPR
jgi:hypothetical protein